LRIEQHQQGEDLYKTTLGSFLAVAMRCWFIAYAGIPVVTRTDVQPESFCPPTFRVRSSSDIAGGDPMKRPSAAILGAATFALTACAGTTTQVQSQGLYYCPSNDLLQNQIATCAVPWVLKTGTDLQQIIDRQQAQAQQQAKTQASIDSAKQAEAKLRRQQQAAKAREAADKRQAVERQREKEQADKMAAQQQQEDDTAAERKKRSDEQEAALATDGYQRVKIEDILHDYRDYPRGTEIVVTGFQMSLGEIDILKDSINYSTNNVYVMTDQLSRDDRKKLIDCPRGTTPYCRVTLKAHPGCIVSFAGLKNLDLPCIIAEEIVSNPAY
jgi:hypothetical protein